MAIHHLRDGEDFGPSHFSKEFGFHGSSEGAPSHSAKERGPHHASYEGSPKGEGYRHGGEIEHHIHPHGHKITGIESHPDGSVTHHHAHGGFTVHHADGEITHHYAHGGEARHDAYKTDGHEFKEAHPHGHNVTHIEDGLDGSEIHHHSHGGYSKLHANGTVTHHDATGGMCGGEAMHRAHGGHSSVGVHPHGHQVIGVDHKNDGSEVHHHAHGGFTIHHAHGGISHHHSDGEGASHADAAQDKAMIKSAFRQHDEHEHGGAHEELALKHGGRDEEVHRARGGRLPMRGSVPMANAAPTPMPVRRLASPPVAAPSLGVASPEAGAGAGDGMSALKHGGEPEHKRRHRE